MSHSFLLLECLDSIDDVFDVGRAKQFRALAEEALDELVTGQRSRLASNLGLYEDFEDDGSCRLLPMLLSLYDDFCQNPAALDPYDRGMFISAVGFVPEFAERVRERVGWHFAARFEARAVAL